MKFSLKLLTLATLLISSSSYALPIDWHGVFGVDSTLIDAYRRIDSKTQTTSGDTTTEPALASGGHANASFQTYVFRLNPVLIINDSATLKGEITSGYGRGGRLGDSSTQAKEANVAHALYTFNRNDTSSTNDDLSLTQLYAELYADSATYLIGRHPNHWALGAVQNSGENSWDRHFNVRDGITMKVKLDNFTFSPYWAKISSGGSLTRATNVKEWGISLLYDNSERDFSFGLLYSKKRNNAFNDTIKADVSSDNTSNGSALGQNEVKITDIYFKKAFGPVTFAVEVPLFSGEIGYLYNNNQKAKFGGKAVIIESNYELNDNWNFGINAGKVSGDNGIESSFDAMYLNPNYQIANVLFRYNLSAIANPSGESVFDSYITNATYAKFFAQYNSEHWTVKLSYIFAKAEEVAKSGSSAFNHESYKKFTASANQKDDLGSEIDLDADYHWNNEITVGFSAGYLMTGDYYGFTNTATENKIDDSIVLQVKTAIKF